MEFPAETRTSGRDPFFELSRVSVKYGQVEALKNISIAIYPGEVLGVVGEHGSGKSTLGRAIGGFARIGGGRMCCAGEDCSRLSRDRARALGIEYVSEGNSLFPRLSVAANLSIGNSTLASPGFFAPASVVHRVGQVLESLGLGDIDPARQAGEIGPSEQMLLAIVRHILMHPRLLILDEVLEKMTSDSLARIVPLINGLRAGGMAVMYATHRIEDIFGFAGRVAILREGNILAVDAVDNFDKIMLLKLAYTQLTRNGSSDEAKQEYFQLVKYNEAILKHLPVNLVIVDNSLSIRMMNDFSRRFFGAASEAAPGQGLDALFPSESLRRDDEKTFVNLKAALRGRREETFLDFRATLAGEEKTITISTLPIYDGSDWIGGMLLIDDVTTRERLREQVILSEKLSSVGLLAAGVAHEINNPLEVVYNYLDWLGRRSKTKAMNDVLGNVKEEMNSIRQIVGNLITFSDVQQPIIEEIDAVSELRALVGLVDIEARRREVHIELTVAEEPVRITANRTEMKQVFLNIIKNSFEAMPGGGRLSISAGIERVKEHNQAVMSFRDTGGGISAANPTDIFLPFYSTKMANGRNLGLGLSITYNIVKKYRGLITVENTVPSGCCFTIRFPTN